MQTFSWTGDQHAFLDSSDVKRFGNLVLGRLGGMTKAGQTKNEDGVVLFTGEDWEFVLLMDAHHSAESARLVSETFLQAEPELRNACEAASAFGQVPAVVTDQLSQPSFLEACRNSKGETACLFVFRKDAYIWWLSIGDCLLYLFHDELAKMCEFEQNTRHFYEWIGQQNAWSLHVPSYTTGTRQLRKGENRLFVTTDGLLECPGLNMTGQKLYDLLGRMNDNAFVQQLLSGLESHLVRDSCTFVCWTIDISEEGLMPSDRSY
ncbi:protein phosphatase 2C domain-containing protein [Terribacillus saccharophilus]|uniref:protein phosphatase 2C domain-containing protein n=1 Tax=Terribacillus saccharophilus TaxID=361277 RepID=UPI003981CF37